MILLIFLFDVIDGVVCSAKSEGHKPNIRGQTNPNTLLWIATSLTYAAAVHSDGIKTLLPNGLSTFSIKGNPVSGNGPKTLSKNPPDSPILCNWPFDKLILARELYAKALQSF